MIELSTYYLQRDINPEIMVKAIKPDEKTKGKSKYEEFTSGNLEDAITKVIKLIANLSTEPEPTFRDLETIDGQILSDFFSNLMQAVSMRQIEKSEEFILNAISCTTNILFYDTAQISLLKDETRT